MDEFLFFIKQGFYHVLDIDALDHVYFFIVLVIIYQFSDWKKSFALITSFTIAHSLTFGLSVFGLIKYQNWVEFVIPITILIPLFLNVYKEFNYSKIPSKTKTNIYFAFFFGLIHGLGFSNYFNMLLDPNESKLLPLLKFSLGIELSQIVVVLFVLTLNYLACHLLNIKKKHWLISVSILICTKIVPMLIDQFSF